LTQIGKLNKRISMQQATNVADGMGGQTQSWADTPQVWAAIWPVSGREQVKNMATQGTISHQIRIRYRSGITPAWRVRFGTRYFNIVSIVNPEEKNEFLDLICKEDI